MELQETSILPINHIIYTPQKRKANQKCKKKKNPTKKSHPKDITQCYGTACDECQMGRQGLSTLSRGVKMSLGIFLK